MGVKKTIGKGIIPDEEGFQEVLWDILDRVSDAVISIDADQRIVLFNHQASNIFGYSTQEIVGASFQKLISNENREFTLGLIAQVVSGKGNGKTKIQQKLQKTNVVALRKNGESFPVALTMTKVRAGGQFLYTAVLQDSTETERNNERMARLAFVDAITGLPNRTALIERLDKALLVARRRGHPLAVMLIDFDRFKDINDTLGHSLGDILLQQVGSRFQEALFEPDIVARMGGDEFAVLLPRLASSEDIHVVSEKILKTLETPFPIGGIPISVYASIGVAISPDHGDTCDSLMRRADVAMYEAKRSKRRYVVYSPEHDTHSPQKLALMTGLRSALDNEELILHYQPKISLKTGRVIGLEGLVRWEHPKFGLLSPTQFIGTAEQTGLINPLLFRVFDVAQRQRQTLQKWGIKVNMSVNLSAQNLQDPNLESRIEKMMTQYHTAPGAMEFEITESAIMQNPKLALNSINRLKDLGLGFSIDDFGTGYSSLAYLKKLPVDTIKIDQSFVKDLIHSENDATIVRSTINLAHNLGLKVIAEGVESKETYYKLAAMDCDAAQGFYICRPIPGEEVLAWLKKDGGKMAKTG